MFERYTERARRAIYYAAIEASHRKADAISPAHILLGITWEEHSSTCAIAAIKDQFQEILPLLDMPLRPCSNLPYGVDSKIPLDRDSKKVLAYAAREPSRYWRVPIGTDSLLLGMLSFPNIASKALGTFGLDLPKARTEVKLSRAKSPPPPVPYRTLAKSFLRFHKIRLLKIGIAIGVVAASLLVIEWLAY
jgi:ATP-dependent Clp protease ATP-binding subunit ClpC